MRHRARPVPASGRPTPHRWAPLVVATLVGVSGCADRSDGAVDAAGSSWPVAGPDLRIGAVDDPDLAFGSVAALAVAPDGTLYSLHPQEVEIRRWSPEGTPLGTVGRAGEGPGEFTRPLSMGFFGDSLWVMDSRAYRVSYFAPDGTYLGSVSPRVDLGSRGTTPYDPPRPERPLRDGTLVSTAPGWSEAISTGALTRSATVRQSADGETLYHIWDRPWLPRDILALPNEDGRGGAYGPQPFGDAVVAATSDHGIAVVDRRVWDGGGEATFGVTVLDFRGDTVWQSALAYDPVELARSRADSAISADAERMFDFLSRSRPGMTLASLEARIAEATFVPPYLPPVRRALWSRSGELWLEAFEPTDGLVPWTVLGAGGERVGAVSLPVGFDLRAVAGTDLWGIERDALDVEYLVRYRVER